MCAYFTVSVYIGIVCAMFLFLAAWFQDSWPCCAHPTRVPSCCYFLLRDLLFRVRALLSGPRTKTQPVVIPCCVISGCVTLLSDEDPGCRYFLLRDFRVRDLAVWWRPLFLTAWFQGAWPWRLMKTQTVVIPCCVISGCVTLLSHEDPGCCYFLLCKFDFYSWRF